MKFIVFPHVYSLLQPQLKENNGSIIQNGISYIQNEPFNKYRDIMHQFQNYNTRDFKLYII